MPWSLTRLESAGIGMMNKEWDTFPLAPRERPNAGPHPAWRGVGLGYNGVDTTPKGRNTFIDFLAAVMTECLRVARPGAVSLVWAIPRTSHWTATACENAGWLIEEKIYHLFGTGFPKHKSKLKPAAEEWILCRKPGPKWLGVEACRIPFQSEADMRLETRGVHVGGAYKHPAGSAFQKEVNRVAPAHPAGRWPANVVLSEDVAAELDAGVGQSPSKASMRGERSGSVYGNGQGPSGPDTLRGHNDNGGPSRFMYIPKADKSDRGRDNSHPTVKSESLMRWLVRLACPVGGVVLDPFMGSGSTGVACVTEGMKFIGIEREREYFDTACKRVERSLERSGRLMVPSMKPLKGMKGKD